MKLFKFTWSDNSSAGTVIVIAENETLAKNKIDPNNTGEYLFDDEYPLDAPVFITTDRNPL